MEPRGCGTFQVRILYVEPREPGSRFLAAAPNHPETLLARPQAFQAVGEKYTCSHIATSEQVGDS